MPREKLADVKLERDHYKKLVEEGFGPRLRELHFGNGEFRADVCGEMVEAMALAFVSNSGWWRGEFRRNDHPRS